MVFEFAPTDDALAEAFWTFSIPSQIVTVPFLLVGTVSEPRVSGDRPSLAFAAVQIGVRGKIAFTLVNDEAAPFAFTLDKASYDATPELLAAAGGGAPVLEVTPDTGTVPPRGKVDLVAVFTPNCDRAINYNVACRVRGKPTPLSINVKGEGYSLSASLALEMADGRMVELAPTGDNAVDFGQVRHCHFGCCVHCPPPLLQRWQQLYPCQV